MWNGRDEAFTAFMAARYGSLLRTATLLTSGVHPRAEDLAHEALRLPEHPGPGHEDQVATAVAVHGLLRTIPPAQRAVLVPRFYHQLTERETAEVPGCSPGTVKSRAAPALAALRAEGFSTTPVPDREIPERGSADD